jgi:hypothetical protein
LVGFPLLSGLWNWYFGVSIEVITVISQKEAFLGEAELCQL